MSPQLILIIFFSLATSVGYGQQSKHVSQSQKRSLNFEQLRVLQNENDPKYGEQFLILEKQLKNENDQKRLVDLYYIHFDYLSNLDNFDSLARTLHLVRFLQKDLKEHDQIPVYVLLATVFDYKNDYDSLIYWEARVSKLIDPSSRYYGKYLLVQGAKNALNGAYDLGIEKVIEAIKIFEKNNEQKDLGSAYSTLAYYYDRLEDYENQKEFLEKALVINKKIKFTYNLINNYNSLGSNSKMRGEFEEALRYYSLAYDEMKKGNFPLLIAQNLTNRANILEKNEKYNDAEQLFLECLNIAKKNNFTYGVVLTKLNLGNLYRLKKDYSQSKLYLEEALSMAKDMKLKREEVLGLNRLAWLYRDSGNFKLAYNYLDNFQVLNDSLVNESVKKEANELKEKYESEKKENEILSLSKQKLFQQFLIGVIIFIFLVVLQLLLNRQRIFIEEGKKEKQRLQFVLELKNKELLADSLKKVSIMHTKDAIYDNIKELIKEIPKTQASKFNYILKELKSANDNKLIEEFETRFLGVYESFFERLKEKAPDLTPTDLKIAALIRLNFSSKEIASLTNRTIGTVENLRSNLRKRLKLEEKENLAQFLLDL